jgi:Fic family protein
VRELLDTPHRKLLNVLLARRGKEMTRKELGELTGYEASGGTFTRYISHLSSLGFVCYPSKGTVAANAILFPKGLT